MGAKKLRFGNPGPPDFWLMLITLAILSLGLVMVFSSSVGYLVGVLGKTNIYYYFLKQVLYAVLGLAAMIFLMNVPHQVYRRFAPMLLLAGIVFLLLVWTPLGFAKDDSYRWVNLGFTSVQPSELIKLLITIFLANALAENGIKNTKNMRRALAALALCAVLVALQPDLGTTMVLVFTGVSMFFAAGLSMRKLLVFAGIVGIGAAVIIASNPYMLKRVMAWYDPWQYVTTTGYQTVNAMRALGSGGLLGVGLGRGMQKFGHVPENYTDMIFATIGEELGFVGTSIVLLLFGLFIWRGLSLAAGLKDPFSRYLAVGITCMVGLQTLMNVGVVTGMLPVTGVTLPFISYGGSSLTLKLASVGILLNVSRYVERKSRRANRNSPAVNV